MKQHGFEALQRANDLAGGLENLRADRGMKWLGCIIAVGDGNDLKEANALAKELEQLGERAKELTARIVDQA